MTLFKSLSHRTNSLRHARLIEKKNMFWKKKSVAQLTAKYNNLAGRNNTGRVVSRTKGTRVGTRIRILSHKKILINVPGLLFRIEYDPLRSAFISLVLYANGVCSYVLHTHGLCLGSRVFSYIDISTASLYGNGLSTRFNNGDSSILKNTPTGTVLFDVERYPGSGGSVSRSAGTFCVLLRKFFNLRKCLIQLPSRDSISFSFFCFATKGVASNDTHNSTVLGKAGRARLSGHKPVVRGVAQNPVDHPHGGGEGKKSKSCFPRTAWGKMLHWRRTGIRYVNIRKTFFFNTSKNT
jgi:large subunit ribosomal protein L2